MKILNSGALTQTAVQFAKAFGVVLAISLFDAIIGAGISAGLWTNLRNEQTINDFWQLGLASFSFFVLYIVGWKNLDVGVAAGLMLTAYLEDTLYYSLLWLTKPIVFWLSNGVLVVNPGFPSHIGGWVGWISRFFQMAPPIEVSLPVVFVLNVAGLVTAWWLLYVENN